MKDIDERQDLGDGRSWTASFDSFDSRHNDVYYGVTIWRGDSVERRFMACVIEYMGSSDEERPAYYRKAVGAVAAAGESNCEWGTDRFPGE